MIFKKLKEKLILAYRFFVASPKVWKLPKKSDILLYDVCGTENLTQYLVHYSCEILPTEGEWVNVPCMLIGLSRACFFGRRFFREYNKSYIRIVAPRIIITCIDNNPEFYLISPENPGIKTIFIQNGLRSARSNLFSKQHVNKKYHVDYMFVFSNPIGRALNQYITGTTLSIGSLKNNAVTLKKNSKSLKKDFSGQQILFVSQYRPCETENDDFFTSTDGRSFSHKAFYSVECAVLKFLANWCGQNSHTLIIAGATLEHEKKERAFYAANLGEFKWTYSPRTDSKISYELVDAAEIVVFIDSTLGYEAFARGKKIAAFSCRGYEENALSANFCWPANLPDIGPFWSNVLDYAEFQRIMDYLIGLSEPEWQIIRNELDCDEVMSYDQNNTGLVGLLEKCVNNT